MFLVDGNEFGAETQTHDGNGNGWHNRFSLLSLTLKRLDCIVMSFAGDVKRPFCHPWSAC
jgi:hypothetical protein